jgi:hypothetical protein
MALWDAVQQAFAFFSTEGITAAAAGGAGGGSGGTDWRSSGGAALEPVPEPSTPSVQVHMAACMQPPGACHDATHILNHH